MPELDAIVEVLERLEEERICVACFDRLQPGEATTCDDCWPREVPR